jgi:hypothetical protein
MNELNSFLVRALELGLEVVAAEEEPLPFFGAANAVYEWLNPDIDTSVKAITDTATKIAAELFFLYDIKKTIP